MQSSPQGSWRGPHASWRSRYGQQGPQVDRYRIVDELGRGGMGVVYKAHDQQSGREVALKVILGAGTNPARLERFRREGEIAAALDHPGILRIHGAGQFQGMPYLAYELVEGCQPLSDVFERCDLRERVRLVRDVGRALGAAHAKGIVHRDVKPDNLLVDSDGRVRVADFGLALGADAERLTQTGALLGTPHFMAPEQFDTHKRTAVGAPADVWALGVVLYGALTDRYPFQEETLVALAATINAAQPERPRSLNPEVSPDLEAVCLRALSRDPEQRYPDGAALAEDLDAAMAGKAVSATRHSAVRSMARRAPWVLVPLAAVVVLAVTLLHAFTGDEPEAPPAEPEVAATTHSPPEQAPEPEPEPEPTDEPDVLPKLADELSEKSKYSQKERELAETVIEGASELLGPSLAKASDEQKGFSMMQKGRAMGSFDKRVAMKYYRQAADYGNAEAMRLLGEGHMKGSGGLERDPKAAFELFVQGGEGGDVDCMVHAGNMLAEGKHVDQDLEQAYAWYLRAAERGHRRSMVYVTREFRRGKYLPKDEKEALFWQKAAEAKGHKWRAEDLR